MTETDARKHDFKSSDLSFYIERLQSLLSFIQTDLDGQLAGYGIAQVNLETLWEMCRSDDPESVGIVMTWFYGYGFSIPDSHVKSYRAAVKDIRNAL